jgi:hypothetical protein
MAVPLLYISGLPYCPKYLCLADIKCVGYMGKILYSIDIEFDILILLLMQRHEEVFASEI